MTKHYFPPFVAICKAAHLDPGKFQDAKTVTIPTKLFQALIKAAITDLQIDLQAYRRQNPDIEAQFAASPDAALDEHFKTTGYFELRPHPLEFDLRFYLRRYPDIQKALDAKEITDPYLHFQTTGIHEMRSPNAGADEELHYWQRMLSADE